MHEDAPRRRTTRWERPVPPDPSLPGLGSLRAIAAGVRPPPPSGLITATGQVVHAGRQMAAAKARVTDASLRLVGTASTTCLLSDMPRT